MIDKHTPTPESLMDNRVVPVQITLIMMTRNRQDHIRPLINYYKDYPIHLIVADGSDSRYVQTTEKADAHSTFKVSYLHFSEPDSYFPRIDAALQLTMTPLVMLVPDDEIFLWGGIAESVDTLNKNANLATSGGASTLCRRFGSRLAYVNYLNYGFTSHDPWNLTKWEELSIESPDVKERVLKVINTPLLHRFYFYRVSRTSVLEKFIALWKQGGYTFDTGLGEFIFALSAHLCGGSHFSLTPFWVRTLKSNYGSSISYGLYSEREIRAITSQIICELKIASISPLDQGFQKLIEDAILGNVGPTSVWHQVLHDYASLGRVRPVRLKLKRIIQNFAPLLAKSIANQSLVDKFSFERRMLFTLGFAQSDTYDDENQKQFARATSALNEIL